MAQQSRTEKTQCFSSKMFQKNPQHAALLCEQDLKQLCWSKAVAKKFQAALPSTDVRRQGVFSGQTLRPRIAEQPLWSGVLPLMRPCFPTGTSGKCWRDPFALHSANRAPVCHAHVSLTRRFEMKKYLPELKRAMLHPSCANACAVNGLPGPMRHWFTGFTHSPTPWVLHFESAPVHLRQKFCHYFQLKPVMRIHVSIHSFLMQRLPQHVIERRSAEVNTAMLFS